MCSTAALTRPPSHPATHPGQHHGAVERQRHRKAVVQLLQLVLSGPDVELDHALDSFPGNGVEAVWHLLDVCAGSWV